MVQNISLYRSKSIVSKGLSLSFAMLVTLFVCGCVYGSGTDDKNITRLLNNQAIVSKQIMCVLEKSPCDQLGEQLKAALPEVILRNCRNCSPQQAKNAKRLTTFLQTRFPDVWAMLLRKYRDV